MSGYRISHPFGVLDTGIRSTFSRDVFPWVVGRRIGEVSAPELLSVLRRVEAKGHVPVAHRLRGVLGQIWRYAIATGRAERNPAKDLEGALAP